MPFVSITRLRRSVWSYLPAFVVQTLRMARQAARADGNLAVNCCGTAGTTLWTGTALSSEDFAKAIRTACETPRAGHARHS